MRRQLRWKKTQKTMKKHYDGHRREAPVFKVGDKVWLEAKNITTDRPTKKLDDRRLGPYEILEKVGASAYKLRLPETDKSHPVFNEALLTPYEEPPAHRREERPAPQIVSGNEEYEVEEILKHRKRGRGYQYLVKWKNYPIGERTWEPRSHLTNAKKLLDRYNVEHGIRVRSVIQEFISGIDTIPEEEKRELAAKLRKMGLMPPKTEESANSTKKQTESLPVLKQGHWDYLIRRYKPKTEAIDYPERYLFDPIKGRKDLIERFPIDGYYVRDTSVEI
jgi:Chromo (CHRromatin Organisation MOdifier) domain